MSDVFASSSLVEQLWNATLSNPSLTSPTGLLTVFLVLVGSWAAGRLGGAILVTAASSLQGTAVEKVGIAGADRLYNRLCALDRTVSRVFHAPIARIASTVCDDYEVTYSPRANRYTPRRVVDATDTTSPERSSASWIQFGRILGRVELVLGIGYFFTFFYATVYGLRAFATLIHYVLELTAPASPAAGFQVLGMGLSVLVLLGACLWLSLIYLAGRRALTLEFRLPDDPRVRHAPAN